MFCSRLIITVRCKPCMSSAEVQFTVHTNSVSIEVHGIYEYRDLCTQGADDREFVYVRVDWGLTSKLHITGYCEMLVLLNITVSLQNAQWNEQQLAPQNTEINFSNLKAIMKLTLHV